MRRVLVLLVLVLWAIPSVGAQPASEAYLVEDAAQDVAAVVAGTRQPVPSLDTMPYIDLTKLEMKDLDEETIEFRLSTVEGFSPMPTGTSMLVTGSTPTRHRIHFTVESVGTPPTKVYLETTQTRFRVENETNAKTNVVTSGVSLCVPLPAQAEAPFCDFFSRFYLDSRIEDGVLVVPLPKEFLTQQGIQARSYFGGGGGGATLPGRLFVGDKLTNIQAVGEDSLEPFGFVAFGVGSNDARFEDRLPDDGAAPEFVLKYPSATNDLVIHYPPYGIVAGEDNEVQIQVDNLAPVKRIVNFTAIQEPFGGKPWEISLTPTVTIAAGQSTNVTLRVRAPPLKDGVGELNLLKIRGDVITQPGTVALRSFYLVPSPPLDADHDTFFLSGDTFNVFEGTAAGGLAGPSFGFAYLTRSEEVAAKSTEPIAMNGFLGFGPSQGLYLMQYAWDTGGIPNPALVLPGEAGKMQVEFDSPVAFEGSLVVQFFQGELLVAQHADTVSLAQGRTTVELPFEMVPGVTSLVPENGTVFAQMELTSSGPEAAAVNAAHFAGQEVSMVPHSTWFELPLERDHSVKAVAAPFKAALAAAEDLEAFINPGKTQVFEFDLRNEETKPVRIEVTAHNRSADWAVEIRPGERYRLEGNDSARIGVLVTAPAGAKEGEVMTFQLFAKDADSQIPVATARLRLIVTSGVEIDDETFAAATEDASKVDAGERESPSVPLLAAVGAVLGLALWRRRRV